MVYWCWREGLNERSKSCLNKDCYSVVFGETENLICCRKKAYEWLLFERKI